MISGANRLIIRPFVSNDAKASQEICGDPETIGADLYRYAMLKINRQVSHP